MATLSEYNLADENALLFYHQAIKALLAEKVNKESGKSLLSDTEITRLATLVNYDDSTITSDIADLKTKISELETSQYDDTAIVAKINTVDKKVNTTAASTLASANSYTDIEIEKVKTSLTSVMHYKGTVEKYTDLPADAEEGDCYNIKTASEHNKAGDNAIKAKDGSWDITSGAIDTSSFLTESDIHIMTNDDVQEILNS